MYSDQTKKYKYIIPAILSVHLILLGIFAAYRIIDADEGFYLNASRMIADGMAPYADFFYTQFAGLPLVFSSVASGGWDSFYTMCAFAVLAGFLSAGFLTLIVYKVTGDLRIAAIALFMYAFSGMSLAWHSTFKVIPFTGFFSLATFYFWLLFRDSQRLLYLIISGLFLSLLISFRSLFMVLLPAYVLSVYYLSQEHRRRNFWIMILSMIPLSLPNALVIANSFEKFYYGNVIFQMTRDINRSLGDIVMNRLVTLYRVLIDPHLLIIFTLAVVSVIFLFRKKKIVRLKDLFIKAEGMAVLNLALIAIVFTIPHPMARRYVDNYLMFAIIVGAFSIQFLSEWFKEKVKPATVKIMIGGATALYVVSLVPYFAIFLFGMRGHDQIFRITNVREVTDHMLAVASETDTVFSGWAGYTFITGQTPLRYTEIVGYDLGIPLSHEEYLKCNLCDGIYLKDQVAQKIPNLVVLQNSEQPYYADLMAENYDRTYKSDVAAVYKRK